MPRIKEWFRDKKEYFEYFARNDTRLEGWFKGELLVLFEQLKSEDIIDDFERETNVQTNERRIQIDFTVKIEGEEHLCELKAACISQAKGTPRNVKFYFRDDHVGLVKDFRKLDQVDRERKCVLGFFYPKPLESEWQEAVATLPQDVEHWGCVTKLDQFPSYLFIALWRP